MNNENTFIAAEFVKSPEDLFTFIIESGITVFDKEEQYAAFLRDNYTYNSSMYEHDLMYMDY